MMTDLLSPTKLHLMISVRVTPFLTSPDYLSTYIYHLVYYSSFLSTTPGHSLPLLLSSLYWEIRMLEPSFGPVGVAALTEIASLQSPWSYEHFPHSPCTH